MEILLSILVILMFVGTLIYILVKPPSSDKMSTLFNASTQETTESEEVFERLSKAKIKPNFLGYKN